MPFVLTIDDGAGAERQLWLDQGRVCIGRAVGNDVVLPDAGVSRLHARIEQGRDGFVLHDEGSANGTELNGARLSAPERLRRGDRIGIGPSVLIFAEQESDGAGISPPAASRARIPAGRAGGRQVSRRSPARWSRLPRSLRIAAACAAGVLALGLGALALRGLREHRGSASRDTGWMSPSPGTGEPKPPPPDELLARAGRKVGSPSQDRRGKDWSAGDARVELLAAGSLEAARGAYERGRRKLEERRIAPRNLHDAWKSFAEASSHLHWIEPRPRLSGEVERLLRDCERDLERECGKLVFTALRFERYGEEEKAQQAWREVLLHFPAEDPTGCRRKAQGKIVAAQAEAE